MPGPDPPLHHHLSAQDPVHPRVLKRRPSPSPDRPYYWLMEASYPEASPQGCRGHSWAIHGCGSCPTWVTPVQILPSKGQQGRRREKKITKIRWRHRQFHSTNKDIHTTWKTIGPRGHPRGTLAMTGSTTPTTSKPSPSPTLSALALPPSEVGASDCHWSC
jgi:hypothetical protein